MRKNPNKDIFGTDVPGSNGTARYRVNPDNEDEIILVVEYNETVHGEDGEVAGIWRRS